MSIPRSRFKRRWVYLQFCEDGEWQKGFVRRMTCEAGHWCYEIAWEDGDIEPVFVGSIHRIVAEMPKKAKVIDFAKRRRKRIKLV